VTKRTRPPSIREIKADSQSPLDFLFSVPIKVLSSRLDQFKIDGQMNPPGLVRPALTPSPISNPVTNSRPPFPPLTFQVRHFRTLPSTGRQRRTVLPPWKTSTVPTPAFLHPPFLTVFKIPLDHLQIRRGFLSPMSLSQRLITLAHDPANPPRRPDHYSRCQSDCSSFRWLFTVRSTGGI